MVQHRKNLKAHALSVGNILPLGTLSRGFWLDISSYLVGIKSLLCKHVLLSHPVRNKTQTNSKVLAFMFFSMPWVSNIYFTDWFIGLSAFFVTADWWLWVFINYYDAQLKAALCYWYDIFSKYLFFLCHICSFELYNKVLH